MVDFAKLNGGDICDLDLETQSDRDLPKVGTPAYIESEHTDALLMRYSFDGGPIQSWRRGQPCPANLRTHVEAGKEVWGFNVHFERRLWNSVFVRKYGFPRLALEQCHCVMALGLSLGLPGSLDNCSAAVGADIRKDHDGYLVMMKLCKPRDWSADGLPIFWTEDTAPEDFAKLGDYCATDVRVQQEIRLRLHPIRLSPFERRVWLLDARMNDRGVAIDRRGVAAALKLVEFEMERLNARLSVVTNGVVTKLTQRDRLLKWLEGQGVVLPSLAKNDLKTALDEYCELPDSLLVEGEQDDIESVALDSRTLRITGPAREALEIRREGAKSSTSKLLPMLLRASGDGRVRDLVIYSKAHTRRWGGSGIQNQNFPRGTLHLSPEHIGFAIGIIKSYPAEEASKLLEALYGPPMHVVSDCLRGFLVAGGEDGELVATDHAQVEARGLAYLCGDQEELDAFERGEEIYCYEASRMFGRLITKKDKDERQQGKVGKLAFQYGGSVGAGHAMGKVYGLHLPDEEWQRLCQLYRDTHPRQRNYWYALERAATQAILNPGEAFDVLAFGHPERFVRYKVVGSFLLCGLPSGGVMAYPDPEIREMMMPWGVLKDCITYMGVHPKIKKWLRLKTWGGKLAENVTQSFCRDIFVEGLLRLDESGYPLVLQSHDEGVIEGRRGQYDLAEVNRVFAIQPAYAQDLPIDATGWVGPRYRKE